MASEANVKTRVGSLAKPREVRIRQIPDRYDGKRWHSVPQALVLVDSNAWVLVRNAKYPGASPMVMSRKEWDKLPVKGNDA